MTSFHVQEILKATEGSLLQGDPETSFRGIATDSRTLREGDLFVALSGKRYNGHAFAVQALRKGAGGVLVSEEIRAASKTSPIIAVPDTLLALGAVAACHRRKFSIPVIAVTGSNGKSTTKELIAHLLSAKGPVLKNSGTQNNRIGVPLTLLGLTPAHAFLVLEMGMNQKGEIGILSKMALPTTGVITNIGPAHLEHLGDLKTVFRCKMEILEGLEKGGTLVLNGDDPFLRKASSPQHRVVRFGRGTPFSATAIHFKKDRTIFRYGGEAAGSLPLIGEHHVANALAAAAVASLYGIPPASALRALKTFQGLEGRMTSRRIRDVDFIDDTYNANPESTRYALESLVRLPTRGRRIVLLGDMLELGKGALAYHAALGEKVASSRIDFLITVGESARAAHERAYACGMNGFHNVHMATTAEAAAFLLREARPGDRVLVKGSRGMRMEDVIGIFQGSRVQENLSRPL